MRTRRLYKTLLIVLCAAIAAVVAILIGTNSGVRHYKKVKLDIDYFLFNSTDETGFVILKDGWHVPCVGLQYLIDDNYLVPKGLSSSAEQKYYINKAGIDYYLYSEYHRQRIGEISHYTDNILDYNSYYSLKLVACDRSVYKDHLWENIYHALFYWSYVAFPVLGRRYVFNHNYMSFRNKQELKQGQYVYKYNGLDNVYLLYDQRSPISTELKQYPTLLFCDSLPDIHCIEQNESGRLYVLQPTYSIKYRLGYLLWKDDVYLSTYGDLPELPASFSEKIDSAINESNRLLRNKWINSYSLSE